MLAATLIAACVCAYLAQRYRVIKSANVAIKDAGGTCGYSLDGPKWLRELVGNDLYFYNPLRITLGSDTGNVAPNAINDETIATMVPHIQVFSRFETLDLRAVAITDNGIATLSRLDRLKTLRIESPNITDDGISLLRDFSRLERLVIDNCGSVSQASINELRTSRPGITVDYYPTNGG